MERKTILFTGGGSPGMPGILRCLKYANDTNFRYIGADMNPYASCRHQFDAFYPIPAAKSPDFLDKILEICEKEGVDLLVPCVTREIHTLSKNKEKFKEIGTTVAAMDYDKIEIVNNKANLLSELKKKGMEVPEFYVAEKWEQAEEYAKKLGYPNNSFCVKQEIGNGSRAVRVILPYDEMATEFFENKPNGMICSYSDIEGILKSINPWPCRMVIMENLPGFEFCVDIIAKDGKVISIVGRRSTVVVSSNAMQCVIEKNEYIENYCKDVVKKLNLTGNIGFDFKCDKNGIPRLLEINPRLTGGIVACCAAGVNLPYLGILSWLNMDFELPKINYGVRMIRRHEEIFFDKNDNLISF